MSLEGVSFTGLLQRGNIATETLDASGGNTNIDIEPILIAIDNKVRYYGGIDAAAPTTDDLTGEAFKAIGPGEECNFVVGIGSSGGPKVIQGRIRKTTDLNANPLDYGGGFRTSVAIIAIIHVKNAHASNTWTFGVSNWNATSVTTTDPDYVGLPTRP